MPWIHVHDIARLHAYIIEHPEMKGVFNAVAPEVTSNEQFTKMLGKVLSVHTFSHYLNNTSITQSF